MDFFSQQNRVKKKHKGVKKTNCSLLMVNEMILWINAFALT